MKCELVLYHFKNMHNKNDSYVSSLMYQTSVSGLLHNDCLITYNFLISLLILLSVLLLLLVYFVMKYATDLYT